MLLLYITLRTFCQASLCFLSSLTLFQTSWYVILFLNRSTRYPWLGCWFYLFQSILDFHSRVPTYSGQDLVNRYFTRIKCTWLNLDGIVGSICSRTCTNFILIYLVWSRFSIQLFTRIKCTRLNLERIAGSICSRTCLNFILTYTVLTIQYKVNGCSLFFRIT